MVNVALTRPRYKRAPIPNAHTPHSDPWGDCVTAPAINRKNLLGLADRPGNDIRARLLLALTALYVERATHTEEEKRQYAELAQRLIDVVDETTRTAVASILRGHPTASIEISGHLSQNAPPDSRAEESARIPAIDVAPAPEAAASPHDALDPSEWGEAFFAATPAARRSLLMLIAKKCEGQNAESMQDIAQVDYERSTPPPCRAGSVNSSTNSSGCSTCPAACASGSSTTSAASPSWLLPWPCTCRSPCCSASFSWSIRLWAIP